MAKRPDSPADTSARDDRHRTDHLQQGLARRSVVGTAVTMVAQLFKVAMQLATIIVLARLLSPTEFGLFAIVAAFLTVFELFKDLGLSSATVQRADITDRQISTLFWMNVGLGAAIAVVLAVASPAIAWIYDEPAIAHIAPAVAFTLVFTGIAAQHLAILRRQMRFLSLAFVQTGAELVAMSAAVAAAMSGLGLWSLVVQRLTWGAMIALGSWVASGWMPGRPGRFSDVRGLVAFGGNVTGAMILGSCAGSFDKMLIGWFWGASSLGLFERAQKLIMMPIQNINVPLATVALPMLSRLMDRPDSYRRAYTAIAERVAMAVAPGAGLIIAAAAPLVELILGAKWTEAAPILAWMGVSAVYMPITYTLSWLYMSQDRTPEMLRASSLNAIFTVGAVVAALPLGPAGIAAALAISGAAVRVPTLFWLAGRRGPISFGGLVGVLVLPVAGAASSAASVWAVGTLPEIAALSDGGKLAVYAATAGIAALCVYFVAPRGRQAILETLQLPRMMRSQGVGA